MSHHVSQYIRAMATNSIVAADTVLRRPTENPARGGGISRLHTGVSPSVVHANTSQPLQAACHMLAGCSLVLVAVAPSCSM